VAALVGFVASAVFSVFSDVAAASFVFASDFGSFYTSECRGGVERRQLELKGIEGGD
jgi:hypothetical protein